MNFNLLLNACVYFNPERSHKCNEFILELKLISQFIIDKINETNLTIIIITATTIIFATLYFTRNN